MKQFLIIQLILYFGWLSCIVVAQLDISGAITGSASFPHVGIICLGNLAVFITSFLRKRLDLEMAARDFLATITGPCQFKEIPKREQRGKLPDIETGACRCKEKNKHELIAVTQQYPEEASVIILSNSAGMTNSCIRQFMQYIYNAHTVHSVLLKYDVFKSGSERHKSGSEEHNCNCVFTKVPHCKSGSERHKSGSEEHNCNCIVISKKVEIDMPQAPEKLPEWVILPSLKCLKNECHECLKNECPECKPDLLPVDVEVIKDKLNVEFSSAVWDALDFEFATPTQEDPICICIPVHPASDDDKWTKLLVRMLKYKDEEDKGAIVAAADALQKYLDKRGDDRDEEIGDKTVSLMVIRLVEIFVNLLLTVFFKVDGFSSALAARRAVRSYVVDSKGNGLPANVFLTSGLLVVKSDSVCQVLKFRGNICFWLMRLSTSVVNLLCAIAWAVVLIFFKGGIGKWYAVPSMAPSKPRVAVIIAAICIGIVMDCFEFRKLVMECIKIFRNGRDISNESNGTDWKQIRKKIGEDKRNTLMILGVIIFEIGFAVAFGLNKDIGRWVYGALQLLVWVKWLFGSFILGAYSPEYVPTCAQRTKGKYGGVVLEYSSAQWHDEGSLVYSSSFLLNAVMVGVMGDWVGIWSTWK